MLQLKDITLNEKKLFDDYFQLKQYEISDMTFTNLYMWRKSYQIKYAIIDDFLCIFARQKDNKPFTLMPVGNGNVAQVLEKLMDYFRQNNHPFMMKSITHRMIEEIENAFPGKFKYIPSRDTYDYVYNSSDLINLEGRKYHRKRNHINKFLALNSYVYEPLTVDSVEECKKAAEEWCRKRDCNQNMGLLEEKEAIFDVLNHFEELKVKGGVIRVDGKVVCFTFGEQFTKDMVVIHVEKADPDIQGSYAIINQQFCAHEWANVKYINREEDLGLPGLRQAKQSYHPVRLIEKHIAILNEQVG